MKFIRLYGKELKKLYQALMDGYGCDFHELKKLVKHHTFFLDKDQVYCFSGTSVFDDTILDALPLFQIGYHFGRWIPQGVLLSPEGASFILPIARKQVFMLSEDQMKEYLHGQTIAFDPDDEIDKTRIYLLAYRRSADQGSIALGCAKWYQGEIHNYFGKERRVSSL